MGAPSESDQHLYRSILENAAVGVIVYRLEKPDDIASLRLIFVNREASRATQSQLEELVGKRIFEAFPNLAETELPAQFHELLRSGEAKKLGDARYGDEAIPTATFEVEASPIDKQLLVVTFRNVTDLRQAQEELVAAQQDAIEAKQDELLQYEKMAALGNLLAGVGHEIKTPLGALKSNNDLLMRVVERIKQEAATLGEQAAASDLTKMEKVISTAEGLHQTSNLAIDRITGIVNSLRTFARVDQEKEVSDVHQIMESTLTLAHHELKYHIQVEKDYGNVPTCNCYPNQLNQVFLNILINAAQAIEGKGTIWIKTFVRDKFAVIEIRDSGKGISKDDLPKIFDAGFTTKPSELGTGLGLAIISKIIKDHDGKIEVESEVGKGTTFRVCLPPDQEGLEKGTRSSPRR